MNSHQLGLEFLETSNPRIFKISDVSVYNSLLAATCPELLITVPGFQYSASIDPSELTQGFNLVLTACKLGIQIQNCDSKNEDIPDGIYAIKYSISPNEFVYVEYNYFRTTQLNNRLQKVRCDLDANTCYKDEEQQQKFLKIREVSDYIAAAKASLEDCHHDVKKATSFYNLAKSLLEKLDCKNCG